MMKPSKAQIEHWKQTGLAMGYPVCCIYSFVELRHLKSEWPNKWAGTGFIPCRICAERPMMEMQGMINAVRQNRYGQFPQQDRSIEWN